ncbi:MAG: hypothetical protein EAZ66_07385, partial [Alphaproteobacteria bacterium]
KADPFKDAELGYRKRLGMLFLNPSMRTRISTQIAAKNLGMDAIVFNVGQDGWTLEMKIPYAALRFPDKEEQVWGLN